MHQFSIETLKPICLHSSLNLDLLFFSHQSLDFSDSFKMLLKLKIKLCFDLEGRGYVSEHSER